MSRAVYKYRIGLGEQELALPVGAEIIHLDVQRVDGQPQLFLWAVVQPESSNMINHKLVVVGTGHPMPEGEVEHLGTIQSDGFVWHAFKVLLP